MSGHRPFSELTRRLSPARKALIVDKEAALNAALLPHELRLLDAKQGGGKIEGVRRGRPKAR